MLSLLPYETETVAECVSMLAYSGRTVTHRDFRKAKIPQNVLGSSPLEISWCILETEHRRRA
jgi:hypothetical protein